MVCFFAAILSFNAHAPKDKQFSDMSMSYRIKWVKNSVPKRYAECERLLNMASNIHKSDIDITPLNDCEKMWVLATAIQESGLRNDVVSKRKARSSMQTYRRYAPLGCKTRKCDLRNAGIYHATTKLRKYGMCTAAAKYNAGPRGDCGGLGSGYAKRVLKLYFQLWEFERIECLPDGDKGC